MNTNTITAKKKRLIRRTNECLTLIARGNSKIQTSFEELLPMVTTDELQRIYAHLNHMMRLQCSAYRVLLSEKEEK